MKSYPIDPLQRRLKKLSGAAWFRHQLDELQFHAMHPGHMLKDGAVKMQDFGGANGSWKDQSISMIISLLELSFPTFSFALRSLLFGKFQHLISVPLLTKARSYAPVIFCTAHTSTKENRDHGKFVDCTTMTVDIYMDCMNLIDKIWLASVKSF